MFNVRFFYLPPFPPLIWYLIIIEFPAVLLNLQSRVIEADFHTFVRPTEEPKLSDFCKNYTEISQSDVDNGLLLSEAIRKFHEWIRSFRFSKGIVLMDDATQKQNTVFVTWTDMDLGIYLPRECSRKKIKLPPYFNRWIDSREYYSVSISLYFISSLFPSKKQTTTFKLFSIVVLTFNFWFYVHSNGPVSIESFHSHLH